MIKDTSKYGTVVSYEESEHQGNSGGWDSLRHYIPPSRRGQSPASGVEELARFSEEIRSLAWPLGTDIDGNRFNKYAPYSVETNFDGFKETINEIRRNHQLRCQLLEFFGKKLEAIRELSPYSLPERVYYDDPGNLKHPNHPGYSDKMTSSEYAAVLALSMIDGSFDPDSEDDTRKDGTPIYGQHREAAHVVLASCCRQDSSE